MNCAFTMLRSDFSWGLGTMRRASTFTRYLVSTLLEISTIANVIAIKKLIIPIKYPIMSLGNMAVKIVITTNILE